MLCFAMNFGHSPQRPQRANVQCLARQSEPFSVSFDRLRQVLRPLLPTRSIYAPTLNERQCGCHSRESILKKVDYRSRYVTASRSALTERVLRDTAVPVIGEL